MRARDVQKALKRAERITSLNLRSTNPPLTELPEAVFSFNNLEELNLSGNEIKSLPKNLLIAFPKLKRLNMRHNAGISFKSIAAHTHRLQWLDLSYCGLERLPSFLQNLKSLEYLNLSGNPDLKGIEGVFNLIQLKHLGLSGCGIEEAEFPFEKLDHLLSIDLSHNNIFRLPESFFALSKLQRIILSHNPKLWDMRKMHVFTNLVELNIAKTDTSFLPSSRAFQKLATLDISSTSIKILPDEWVTWSSLKNIACRYKPALRKKIKRMERLRKDFNWLGLNAGQRLRFLRYFIEKTASEDFSTSELLMAANSGFPEIRYKALEIIEQQYEDKLPDPRFNEKAELVFTGRIIFSERFKAQLKEMGIKVSKLPGKHTTHVVIGEYPFFQGLSQGNLKPEILTTRNLYHLLETLSPTKKPDDPSNYTMKIRNLINSEGPGNLELGLQLLRTGFLPPQLVTDLYLIWLRNSTSHQKLIQDLLELHGGPELPRFMALNKWPNRWGKKISYAGYKKLGLDMKKVKRGA